MVKGGARVRDRIRGVRRAAPARPRRWWFALLLPAVAGVLLLAAGWQTEDRYSLWVNGEKVAGAGDDSDLSAMLTQWVEEARSRQVTLVHGQQSWSFRLGELGLQFSLEAGMEQVRLALGERARGRREVEVRLELPAIWDARRLEAALKPVVEAVQRPPASASLEASDDRVTVIPAVVGRSVDIAALRRALETGGSPGRLELPLKPVEPEVTTEALERMAIRRLIAEWSTKYDPSIPRAENVERAAQALDGLILKPGEILSYNGAVGPVDESRGWREAYVIVGGELVEGIGGGICQVATTFYGAALRANLEILERHPHQLAVGYIPPSEDAAVAPGYQDLKVRNTTPGHLLIKTEAEGGRVTFRLYGDLPPGQSVRIESQVTGSLPFPIREIPDPTLSPGQQQQVRGGTPGLTSEAYRLLFVDGKLVRRELLSRDRYLPVSAVVRTGAPVEPATRGSD